MKVPLAEVKISFARSGGPGGQNVNKVATKVILEWYFMDSEALAESSKALLMRHYPSGLVMVVCQETRSQLQNREIAFEKLNTQITKLLTPPKRRRKTVVPRAQRTERRATKKLQGERKKMRGRVRE